MPKTTSDTAMETKANIFIVVSFIALMATGIVFFFYWAMEIGPDRDYDYYLVYFGGPATGLTPTSEVRYNGLRVGTISHIELDRDTPGRVKIVISVNQGTPITNKSVASVQSQGFNGVPYLGIEDDSRLDPDTPRGPPAIPEGEGLPVITSSRSTLLGRIDRAPDIVGQINEFFARADKWFAEGDADEVIAALNNLRDETALLASNRETYADTLAQLPGRIENFNASATSLERRLATSAPQQMENWRKAAQRLEQETQRFSALIGERREGVNTFTGEKLARISDFATDLRRMTASLARIIERVEADPGANIFSPAKPVLKAQ